MLPNMRALYTKHTHNIVIYHNYAQVTYFEQTQKNLCTLAPYMDEDAHHYDEK